MKNKLVTKILATLAFVSFYQVKADSTEETYSNAVGFIRTTLKGASDNHIGIPLERAHAYHGTIQGIAGSVVTVNDTPGWAANQFVQGDPDNTANDTFYCLLMDGDKEGMAVKLTANTANTFTVDPGLESLTGITAGTTVRIIPYWTPATLFEGATLPNGTLLLTYETKIPASNRSAKSIYIYYAGAGWYNTSYDLVDKYPVDRHSGLMLRTPEGSVDSTHSLSGVVSACNNRVQLIIPPAGSDTDIAFSFASPVSVKLGDSDLGVKDRAILLKYDRSATGYRKSAVFYTFYEGAGWYDKFYNNVNDTVVLSPFDFYVLRLVGQGTSNSELVWSNVPSYLELE